MAFVYTWIVFSWADPLIPQPLMEQFDTLLIQCRHVEHMHEGVRFGKNNFCLRRFYCNLLFKTKVCWFELTCQVFSLTLTVLGVSNKHCLLTFFIN